MTVLSIYSAHLHFFHSDSKARGVAPFYINLVPKGLTLKPLLAPKGRIIKARGNAPGVSFGWEQGKELRTRKKANETLFIIHSTVCNHLYNC